MKGNPRPYFFRRTWRSSPSTASFLAAPHARPQYDISQQQKPRHRGHLFETKRLSYYSTNSHYITYTFHHLFDTKNGKKTLLKVVVPVTNRYTVETKKEYMIVLYDSCLFQSCCFRGDELSLALVYRFVWDFWPLLRWLLDVKPPYVGTMKAILLDHIITEPRLSQFVPFRLRGTYNNGLLPPFSFLTRSLPSL